MHACALPVGLDVALAQRLSLRQHRVEVRRPPCARGVATRGGTLAPFEPSVVGASWDTHTHIYILNIQAAITHIYGEADGSSGGSIKERVHMHVHMLEYIHVLIYMYGRLERR